MDEKSVVKIIQSFIDAQRNVGKSEGTIKIYARKINEFIDWLKINEGDVHQLTRIDVQQFIQHLQKKGNSASTIENKFAALSVFIHFLGQDEILHNIRRPEFRKSRHIAPKSLNRNERNRVLREVERTKNVRNIAIVYMFLYTGLRVSEMVSLNRENVLIGERRGSVTLRNGKGDVERKVPLPVEARLHLTKYLDNRDDEQHALFLSNYNRRISVRSVQRALEKYGVHPHQLRHTYCRRLVHSGVDIAAVAELAGHNDINVTRRYAKPSNDELEEAVEGAFD